MYEDVNVCRDDGKVMERDVAVVFCSTGYIGLISLRLIPVVVCVLDVTHLERCFHIERQQRDAPKLQRSGHA